MQKVEIPNSGYVAWNNSKRNNCYFVTAQFQTQENPLLQIHELNSMNLNLQSNCIAQTTLSSQVSAISWSNFGEAQQYPEGIISIGTVNGSAMLFNASEIINSSSQELQQNVGLLCEETQLSDVPIYSIKHSPIKNNLIALAGNEMSIIDISKSVQNPELFSPGEQNSADDSAITDVSWNEQLAHILGSIQMSGLITVWDLKTNKPIYNFSDSSQQQNKRAQLCWNPEISTQIAVTYDDDHSYELQIWDLRNPQGPVEILGQGHTNRISSVQWCQADSSLIITGGYDKKLICWNYKNNEVVEKIDFDEEIVQISLCKQIPNQYAVALKNGTVQLGQMQSERIANIPPKWYSPTTGCRFSCDNNIVGFTDSNPHTLQFQQAKSKCDDPAFQSSLQQLVQVIENLGEKKSKETDFDIVQQKIDQNKEENEVDYQEWQMIATYQNSNLNELLHTLGFNFKEIEKKTEDYTGKIHKSSQAQQEEEKQVHRVAKVTKKTTGFANIDAQAAEDFFGSLASQVNKKQDKSESSHTNIQANKKAQASREEEQQVLAYENISKNVNWDAGIEKIIKQNLIIGNYMGAIDCAMKCGRIAEALLIAYSQNKELFEEAMNSYFVSNTDPFIKNVLRNLVKKNIDEISSIYDLGKWRECACILATQCKSPQEFQFHMEKLADRFIKDKSDYDQAILCAILSKNFEKIVTFYNAKLNLQFPAFNAYKRKVALSQLVEKLVLIKYYLQVPYDSAFDRMIYELVLTTYDRGMIQEAYLILSQANQGSLYVSLLLDRIYQAHIEILSQKFVKPAFPMKYINVQGSSQFKKKQTETSYAETKRPGKQRGEFQGQGNHLPQNQLQPNKQMQFNQQESNQTQQAKSWQQQQQQQQQQQDLPNQMKQANKQFTSSNINQQQLDNKSSSQVQTNNKIIKPPVQFKKAAPLQNQVNQQMNQSQNYSPQQQSQTMQQSSTNMTQLANNQQKTVEQQQQSTKQTQQFITPPPLNSQQQRQIFSQHQDQSQQQLIHGQNKQFGHPVSQTQSQQQQQQQQFQQQEQLQESNNQPINNLQQGTQQQQQQQQQQFGRQYNQLTQKQPSTEIGPPPKLGPTIQKHKQDFDQTQVNEKLNYIVGQIENHIPILLQVERNNKKAIEQQQQVRKMFVMLQNGEVKQETFQNIVGICESLQNDDFQTALTKHQAIVNQDWEKNKEWLIPLKRIILRK